MTIPDEEYQEWCKEHYLTLADLHELAEREPYKHSWDYIFSKYHSPHPIYDEKNNLYYYANWAIGLSIVHRHMLIEEYMSKPYSDINWKLVTNYYSLYTIHEFIDTYTHPLAWISESQFPHEYVILGKVAKAVNNYEPYDGRMGTSWKWYCQVLAESILYFVDKNPTYAIDDLKNGIKKGMHRWNYIMAKTDEDLFNHMHFEKELSTFNDGLLYFDVDTFQKNIYYIERMRGGEVAARIIRCFQKEWEGIELWDAFGFSKYPRDYTNKFKLVLFRGFDDLLEEWEGRSSYDPKKLPPEGKYRELALWLEEEKKEGRDHYSDANNNRTQMCKNISKIVGWNVKENSLQKQQNKK